MSEKRTHQNRLGPVREGHHGRNGLFQGGGKAILDAFIHKMQPGDIVVSCYTESTTDAIGIITGNYEWHDEYPEYKRVRNVHRLIKNVR